jgi:hypothetical protein
MAEDNRTKELMIIIAGTQRTQIVTFKTCLPEYTTKNGMNAHSKFQLPQNLFDNKNFFE